MIIIRKYLDNLSISYKTLICAKPLRIRFDKVDGFIRVSDGTRYIVLFGPEKYNSIYNFNFFPKNAIRVKFHFQAVRNDKRKGVIQ